MFPIVKTIQPKTTEILIKNGSAAVTEKRERKLSAQPPANINQQRLKD